MEGAHDAAAETSFSPFYEEGGESPPLDHDTPETSDFMVSFETHIHVQPADQYARLLLPLNKVIEDISWMFLTHSEDDETTSAIMYMPGLRESNMELDWKIIYQIGFLIPPGYQDCTPVYFCNCCPECIQAKWQAEMLLGYTSVTDESHSHESLPSSGSCDHISALQAIVRFCGMTSAQFASYVRQTCKCLPNHLTCSWLVIFSASSDL
jgi:hypothetical protein